jgi:alpha-glucosidase
MMTFPQATIRSHQIRFGLALIMASLSFCASAQKDKIYRLTSPDGNLQLVIEAGKSFRWSLKHKGDEMVAASAIGLKLQGGEDWGKDLKIISVKEVAIDNTITALNYKKSFIHDQFHQVTFRCKGDFGIIFRAYNSGIAYRYFSLRKNEIIIQSELAEFNFSEDRPVFFSYVNDPHNHDIYETSFENVYQHVSLSSMVRDTLAFEPVLIEAVHGKKVAITEADLEDYPGMFLQLGKQLHGFSGRFAPYVLEEKQGGHNGLQAFVTKRADYIARTSGTRSFPWRVAVISENDKDLLNNDMVYALASPSRLTNTSWIRPGKVAWDWWNDWNISHVNFKAGINTATYQYYIDFAASNHIEYILLDEGWADSKDIMKIVPDINLQQIIDYGKQKNVGVWLWGGWLPMNEKMDEALKLYSEMGIKGFKIDFMDRDDQKVVQFYYRLAAKAATYRIMLDFHGAYKPTGLQRTYPNVVNFEGVRGLENAKWSDADMPGYEVTIPFIRMLAGPLDYTPGAMRNASRRNFRAINQTPMSQGTRCHQLAMYVVYEAPFEMLADNPTSYMREIQSLDFISTIPTTFDETVALDGLVGDFVALARRKGNVWYAGAMTNWDARDIKLDLSFLGEGDWQAEIFKDGINSDREGTDYASEIVVVNSHTDLVIHLASGGGWAGRFFKSNLSQKAR